MIQKKRERLQLVAEAVEDAAKTGITATDEISTSTAVEAPRRTIRLSADIQEALHYKLKLYCLKKRQSILEVLQQWIESNCTDEVTH